MKAQLDLGENKQMFDYNRSVQSPRFCPLCIDVLPVKSVNCWLVQTENQNTKLCSVF